MSTKFLTYTCHMAEPRWLDENELRAWRGLQLMQMQVEGELARRLSAESELSYPDYVVLAALTDQAALADQAEPRMRQFELGEWLGWEKSRLSHHVSRMAKRGLVAKERCPSDRRGSFVVVTPEGQAAIEAAAPGHVEAVRELFLDHVTDAQLAVLGDLAESVLGAMAPPPCDE